MLNQNIRKRKGSELSFQLWKTREAHSVSGASSCGTVVELMCTFERIETITKLAKV